MITFHYWLTYCSPLRKNVPYCWLHFYSQRPPLVELSNTLTEKKIEKGKKNLRYIQSHNFTKLNDLQIQDTNTLKVVERTWALVKNYYQELFSVSLPASDKCLDSTSLFQRSYTKRDTSKICQARHLFVITSWDTDKQLPSGCYAFPCKSVTSPHSG